MREISPEFNILEEALKIVEQKENELNYKFGHPKPRQNYLKRFGLIKASSLLAAIVVGLNMSLIPQSPKETGDKPRPNSTPVIKPISYNPKKAQIKIYKMESLLSHQFNGP